MYWDTVENSQQMALPHRPSHSISNSWISNQNAVVEFHRGLWNDVKWRQQLMRWVITHRHHRCQDTCCRTATVHYEHQRQESLIKRGTQWGSQSNSISSLTHVTLTDCHQQCTSWSIKTTNDWAECNVEGIETKAQPTLVWFAAGLLQNKSNTFQLDRVSRGCNAESSIPHDQVLVERWAFLAVVHHTSAVQLSHLTSNQFDQESPEPQTTPHQSQPISDKTSQVTTSHRQHLTSHNQSQTTPHRSQPIRDKTSPVTTNHRQHLTSHNQSQTTPHQSQPTSDGRESLGLKGTLHSKLTLWYF